MVALIGDYISVAYGAFIVVGLVLMIFFVQQNAISQAGELAQNSVSLETRGAAAMLHFWQYGDEDYGVISEQRLENDYCYLQQDHETLRNFDLFVQHHNKECRNNPDSYTGVTTLETGDVFPKNAAIVINETQGINSTWVITS